MGKISTQSAKRKKNHSSSVDARVLEKFKHQGDVCNSMYRKSMYSLTQKHVGIRSNEHGQTQDCRENKTEQPEKGKEADIR